MIKIELVLFWLTVFCYVAAFCVHLFAVVRQKGLKLRLLSILQWLGLACHTGVIVMRWLNGGHMPVTDSYELDLVGTWLTMGLLLGFGSIGKADRALGLVVLPVTFLVLGHGILVRAEAIPMAPAFRSIWLVVHVLFAWLAFGSFLIASGAAFLFLAKSRKPDNAYMDKAPSLGCTT